MRSGDTVVQSNDRIYALRKIDERYFASASNTSRVQVWDFQTLEQVACLKGHIGTVCGVFSVSNGSIASFGYDDPLLYVWSAASQVDPSGYVLPESDAKIAAVITSGELFQNFSYVQLLAGDNVKQIVSINAHRMICCLKSGGFCFLESQGVSKVYLGDNTILLSPWDDQQAVIGLDGKVLAIWNFAQKKAVHRTVGPKEKSISCVLPVSSENIAFGCTDGSVWVWNLNSQNCRLLKKINTQDL